MVLKDKGKALSGISRNKADISKAEIRINDVFLRYPRKM